MEETAGAKIQSWVGRHRLSIPCVEIKSQRCEATCLGPHSQEGRAFPHLLLDLLQGEAYCPKVKPLFQMTRGLAKRSGTPFPSAGSSWTMSPPGATQVLTDDLCLIQDCLPFKVCPGSPFRRAADPGSHSLPPGKRGPGAAPPPTPAYLRSSAS